MTLIELGVLLLIAGVCGAIGQALAGTSRGGFLTSVVLGLVGAFFGAWLARSFSLPEPLPVEIGDSPFPVLWSIVGSALFVAVLSALTRGGRRSRG